MQKGTEEEGQSEGKKKNLASVPCVLEAKGRIVGRRKNFDGISRVVSMNKLPIKRFLKVIT